MEADCTIPFISRYRKEHTGNLDEVAVGAIANAKEAFDALEKRKKAILKSLEEQAVLTAELKEKIAACVDLISLEDLYLPYKKSRKTKAETARKNGLEPLAKVIMAQRSPHIESLAQKYVNSDVPSTEDAITGAQHIIAEWVNERLSVRNNIRRQLERHALLTTKVIGTKKDETDAQKFRDYFDFSEPLNRCPSHRFLAIQRAVDAGYIRTKVGIDDEIALNNIERQIIKYGSATSEYIQVAIKDAYKRLLLPSLTNEILALTKQKADEAAIEVFAKNLKQLLLGAPLGEKRILAIDPGFRTGCKVVCLVKMVICYTMRRYSHMHLNAKKPRLSKRLALL